MRLTINCGEYVEVSVSGDIKSAKTQNFVTCLFIIHRKH